MKNKQLIISFIVVIILTLIFIVQWSGQIYSAEQQKTAPGKTDNKLIIAHKEIFGKLERPQVLFNHGLHTDKLKEKGCELCHPPVAANDENLVFYFPFKMASGDRKSLMDSYHEKCIGCHRKMMAEKKKAGPVQCGNCHAKEFESVTIKHLVAEFDFLIHDKHGKKLKEKKVKDICRYCHHIYNEELVYEEGTEQSCYYCHDEQKKRGPFLSVETGITYKKGLTLRRVTHSKCLNCHLSFKKKGEKAGPTVCSECHTGKYKTAAELEKIPRPGRNQPEKPFIKIDDGKMKGVSFNHRFHEKNNRTCRGCHHETLNACKKCHGILDKPDGKSIKIADAYHNNFSDRSCAGCHNKKKSAKECSGCHHHLIDVDFQSRGPQKAVCGTCHSGQKQRPDTAKPLNTGQLSTKKVPEKVTVKTLERQYEPAEFPHFKMVKKLVENSNKSEMAKYFHRDMQTICNGCHHRSIDEAEAEKNKPLLCRNCHSISFDSQNVKRPRLLAVYHQQCRGCHDRMALKPVECKDCHKEKAVMPANILPKD